MKFEGLDVYGFKAFADKATISFNDGITAIVGPNGCGKSNVVDAVRWVLGEQSAKLLRGNKMQDVIFNGTERRKALSYCEVALKFNNEGPDRIFKTLEMDQVIISRKLFRNGNSEYLINGTNVNLRDIKALIRETGLGREGYSIVGQGKIDEIMNAKPENRRAIFEDAAGVLGLKAAKKQAEANLENYKLNKTNFENLLAEIERNLTNLDKQSEKAQKYLQIRDELMHLEANSYIFQHDNNGIQKEKIRSKIEGLKEQIDLATSELQQKNEKFNNATNEQLDLDAQLRKIQDEKTVLSVKEEKERGTGNTINATREGLLRTKDDYSKRLTELEQEFDSKNATLRDLYAKQSMATEDRESLQNDYNEASKKQNALVAEILEKERQIDSKNKEISKLLESVGDIKANLGKIQAERAASLERIADYATEINDLQKQIDDNEYIRSEQEKVKDKFKAEKDRLEKTVTELSDRYNKLEDEIDSLRDREQDLLSTISGNNSKLNILEEIKNSHEGFAAPVQKLLKAADVDSAVKSRIQGVVADIIKVPEKYQQAIEVALGGNIQNVVVENEDAAKYLIQYLKTRQFGRVTFLPISSFKSRELDSAYNSILREKGCLGIASKLIQYSSKFNTIVSGLLGSTIVCEDYDCAVAIARRYSYSIKIVTLQGDVLNTTGSISGGSQRANSVSVLSQDAQIEKLRAELSAEKKELADVEARYKECAEEYDDLASQIDEYEDEASNSNENYTKENTRFEAIVSILVDLNGRLSVAKKHKSEAEEKCAIISDALAKVDKQNQDLSGNKDDVNDEAMANRELFNAKKQEKEELDQTITDLKVSLSTNEVDLSNFADSIKRIENEKRNITASINDCRAVLANNETSIKNNDSKINKDILTPEEKKKLKEIDATIKKYEEKKAEMVELVRKISAEKDEISNNLLRLGDTKSKQENTLLNIDEKMAALETRIMEDYGLDYEKSLMYQDPDFKYEESQGQIKSLKASKASLGEVNVNAIEDFKNEKIRYDEMHTQYEDILTAEADCNGIIAQLSKDILEKFTAEFTLIDNNFREIFPQLFGGGSGKLIVNEVEPGEDPLEAGVEIMVQPPGKRVQTMSLLSGGEKALTALAILFAILKMRPMPFCILDEVEAALDEGNVGIYANYIKNFSKTTQFIVITHRKPTMEKADILFGVTMQEKGVSKVVQVALSEAVEQAAIAEAAEKKKEAGVS